MRSIWVMLSLWGFLSLSTAATEIIASEVELLRSEDDPAIKIEKIAGEPFEFSLKFTRQMPTPGWTFVVDSLRIEQQRIAIELTDQRPSGMVAQVISKGTATIPLGKLETGRYVVEIRTRRGTAGAYRLSFAAVIVAR